MSTFDLVLLFSPQNCSLELLEANLTSKRRELADSVVARIKDAAKQRAGRYDLLIGPRGTGKTHVLAYIEQVLRRDVGDGLRIVHLSEEEFGIGTMLDFLVACLQAAHVPLDPLYDELRGPKALEIAEKAFLANLNTSPSLLVVENFALVLDAMDTGEQRRLRTFLQSNPQISVLASSPWLFGDSDKPDHPFHGFFLIEPLDSLTRVQARDYLIQLAKWKGDEDLVNELRTETAQARVNAIHDLTGGNHRLLGMLSECLRADDLQTLIEPFVRLVDRELTPYYQQRLGRLAAQPYKILKTLARQQGAIPVKEIARLCFVTEQTTSGQLRVLKDVGIVRSEQRGRESYYELQEPLLRFVLDIKEGRERLLPSMVALLREWYAVEELRDLATKTNGISRDYFLEALDEKFLTAVAVSASEELYVQAPIGTAAADHFDDDKILEDLTRCFSQVRVLHEMHDYASALALYGEIEQRYGTHKGIRVQAKMAWLLMNKGAALDRLGCYEEAVSVFTEVEQRYGAFREIELQQAVAWALVNKGAALGELGHYGRAVAVFEDAERRYTASEDAGLQREVARALVNKGVVLRCIEREQDALRAFDEVISRFGARNNTALARQLVRAQFHRCLSLQTLGRGHDAAEAYQSIDFALLDAFYGSSAELFAACVEGCRYRLGALTRLIETWPKKQDINPGLTHWVQLNLPLTEEQADKLEETERNLRKAFADVEGAAPVLDVFSASRAYSLGDSKTLLRLPLEARRLVERAYGIAKAE